MNFEYHDMYNPREVWSRQQQAFPVDYYQQFGEVVAPFIAPPNFKPPFPNWQVGSEGIRSCINRNTYIWLHNGSSFWFFPIFVSRQSVVGFRWSRVGWTYNVVNRRNILSYQCF